MSTVTSCTLLGLGSAVRPPVYSSGRPAAVGVASLSSQRTPRPLSVCCATSQKGDHNPKTDLYPFNIPAFVLVHPVSPREERWQLQEDAEKVNLWFEVPGQSQYDLSVEIDEDVLVIKKKVHVIGGDVGQRSPGGGVTDYAPRQQTRRGATATEATKEAAAQQGGEVIYARMLLPAGYSREGVEAELKSGVLMITVAKIKERARRKIDVSIQVK
ncbi:small heat shock protein, chloroplastic-like [Miscanthus floridulus]|uniref:small heat shock protein, chloroplastic-like n=1 Tax=Miscanthus floridulus TaxID=154761 RepID=UPI00345AB0FD